MGACLCTSRHSLLPPDHDGNEEDEPMVRSWTSLDELLKCKCFQIEQNLKKKQQQKQKQLQFEEMISEGSSKPTLVECLLSSPSFEPAFLAASHRLASTTPRESFSSDWTLEECLLASPGPGSGRLQFSRQSPKVCPVNSMGSPSRNWFSLDGGEADGEGSRGSLSRSQSRGTKRVSFRWPEADVHIFDSRDHSGEKENENENENDG